MILNYAPALTVRWLPNPRSREAARDFCSLSLTDAQEPEKEHPVVRRRALFLLERGPLSETHGVLREEWASTCLKDPARIISIFLAPQELQKRGVGESSQLMRQRRPH